jgi:hydroxypyruvate isomerase
MPRITRRALLKSSVAGVAAAQIPSLVGALSASEPRKGRIRQSVSRWCYQKIPLDQLSEAAAQMGLRGVALLPPDYDAVPRGYFVIFTMAYA